MNNKRQLSDNHRRVISSRVQMIESKIAEIEQMLRESPPALLSQIKEPMTDKESKYLLGQLHKIQSLLEDLSEHYQLQFYQKSQRAMVLSRLSHMLDISEDMYAEKLKGYGCFPPELKEGYNHHIAQVEKAIKKTFAPFQ